MMVHGAASSALPLPAQLHACVACSMCMGVAVHGGVQALPEAMATNPQDDKPIVYLISLFIQFLIDCIARTCLHADYYSPTTSLGGWAVGPAIITEMPKGCTLCGSAALRAVQCTALSDSARRDLWQAIDHHQSAASCQCASIKS